MEEQEAEGVAKGTAADSYLAEQKKAFAEISVGAKDPNGNRIAKIYARGDEHIIYEVADVSPIESLKVYIHTKLEEDMKPLQNFQEVKETL